MGRVDDNLFLPVDKIITTPRLRIRRLVHSDLHANHVLRADPLVMKYSPTHLPDADEAATKAKLGPLMRSPSWSMDVGAPNEVVAGGSYFFGIELEREWAEKQDLTYEEGRVIGHVGITGFSDGGEGMEGEIGYLLAPELWGKGLATEAVMAFARHWDDLVDKWGKDVMLTAATEEDNVGSRRVLIKCGFRERRRWVRVGNGDRLITMVRHKNRIDERK